MSSMRLVPTVIDSKWKNSQRALLKTPAETFICPACKRFIKPQERVAHLGEHSQEITLIVAPETDQEKTAKIHTEPKTKVND